MRHANVSLGLKCHVRSRMLGSLLSVNVSPLLYRTIHGLALPMPICEIHCVDPADPAEELYRTTESDGSGGSLKFP